MVDFPFTLTVVPVGRTRVTFANGYEFTFGRDGELVGVGFLDPETPRTQADWDEAYRAAYAWRATHPFPWT